MKRAKTMHPAGLILLGAALTLAGCSGDNGLGPNQGRVRFVLSSGASATGVSTPQTIDQPTMAGQDGTGTQRSLDMEDHETHDYSFFQTANVTFSSILARNQDGVLTNVSMDLPVTVDLVAMDQGGSQVSLPDGALDAGTYDQLVVVMTQVDGVARDGTQISLTPPGGGWTAIVPICPFTVADGGSTTVSLQFMVRQAFLWRNGRFLFQPRLQCSDAGSGSGSGG